jgi:hypothetical protein
MNIRDTASIGQLLILANLEAVNSDLIRRNIIKQERIRILFRMAKAQMETFDKNDIEKRFRNQFPQSNVGNLIE